MSVAGPGEDNVKSTVPVPDLSCIDRALAGDPEGLREAIRSLRPADLGRELSRRTPEQALSILNAIDDRRGSAMLRAAHPSVAAQLIAGIDTTRAVHLLSFVPTDREVAILGHLTSLQREKLEACYPPREKAGVDRLLAYPENAVGRLMTTKVLRCERSALAGAALDALGSDRDEIEVAVNCYVTDGGVLVGVVPLRELAVADRATPVVNLMTPDPIAVRGTAALADAAEIIHTHSFLSIPVVDDTKHLIGAVRIDDLFGATLDKFGTGFLNQAGVRGQMAGRAPYFLTPILRTVRSRLTWLVLLFVAETATGTVLRYFDDELAKVVALSFFVPLLIGTGGNAGSQTVSTIIRALALGEVRVRDVARVVRREVTAGVVLGVLLGTIAFFRALLWGVDYDLAICVAVTILAVCTWANAVGAAIPLAAQRFGIDPTVISAPLITTLVDASGLFIYFTVAKLMIASLSTATAAHEIPKWQSVSIVARSQSVGDMTITSTADAEGHVRTLALATRDFHIDVPAPYLATLPPLELATVALRGEGPPAMHVLTVGFATGGGDDEHVVLTIDHGAITGTAIVRISSEGKEKRTARPPPPKVAPL